MDGDYQPRTRCHECGHPANTWSDGRCAPCSSAHSKEPIMASYFKPQVCRCGCETATKTKTAKYLPGHDAKHVSVVLRDLRAKALERGITTKDEFDRLALDYAVDRFEVGSGVRAKYNRAADRLWARVSRLV